MIKNIEPKEYSTLYEEIISPTRLNVLKEEKFLTQRVLTRISENMHYEVFKFLNCKELLELRATNLGGFQLTSNKILRSRIGNYFLKIQPNLIEENNTYYPNYDLCHKRVELVFEQTGRKLLNFDEIQSSNKELITTKILIYIMKLHPDLEGINLGK